MRTDSLQQFVRLRHELTQERESLQARLQEINQALGEMPLPSLSSIQGTTGRRSSGTGTRGRKAAGGGQSLRDHVIAVLQSGPKTKEEILSAVQSRGYKFSTNNPMNSLGVILYGKNPKLTRADGKFSLGRGTGAGGSTGAGSGQGARTMSAAGRARIAAAQKARWAKARSEGGGAASNRAGSKGAGAKRKMSPAARKAIAEAARKRWAAAKAAGRSRL